MSLLGLLDQTCTTRRATYTKNAQGEEIPTWSDNATGVRCHIEPISGDSPLGELARSLKVSHQGFIEASGDVRPATTNGQQDAIICNSITYYVKWTQDAASRGRVKQILLSLES